MSNGVFSQPLQSMKWAARLNAFVLAVVAVNLVIFPLGGAYDPSDFFHTVFKDLPLVSLYAFFGIISLFVCVYGLLFMPSEQVAWPEKRRRSIRPPRQWFFVKRFTILYRLVAHPQFLLKGFWRRLYKLFGVKVNVTCSWARTKLPVEKLPA